MRVPDPVYRFLDRLVTAERARRQREMEWAETLRFGDWAARARTAHQHGNCLPGCPYLHLVRDVDTSQADR